MCFLLLAEVRGRAIATPPRRFEFLRSVHEPPGFMRCSTIAAWVKGSVMRRQSKKARNLSVSGPLGEERLGGRRLSAPSTRMQPVVLVQPCSDRDGQQSAHERPDRHGSEAVDANAGCGGHDGSCGAVCGIENAQSAARRSRTVNSLYASVNMPAEKILK